MNSNRNKRTVTRPFLFAGCILLLAIAPARGSLVSFSFSGTWSSGLGVVQAGDAFSVTATWDTSTVGSLPGFPTFAPLSTLSSFSLPSSEGFYPLQISFEGANYTSSTSGIFEDIQIDLKSSTDGNIYILYLGSIPACNPDGCNADLASGSRSVHADIYAVTGPSTATTPEPDSRALLPVGLVALALLSIWLRRKGIQCPVIRARADL
jgi:hypothetical protein